MRGVQTLRRGRLLVLPVESLVGPEQALSRRFLLDLAFALRCRRGLARRVTRRSCSKAAQGPLVHVDGVGRPRPRLDILYFPSVIRRMLGLVRAVVLPKWLDLRKLRAGFRDAVGWVGNELWVEEFACKGSQQVTIETGSRLRLFRTCASS